ncbi:MAG: HEPN domain-containing protein [Candidatus Gastranaerophilales bacterium]|nr:HEPN domain-containing protein [Candidatus Gastranaerophilales bacterium]
MKQHKDILVKLSFEKADEALRSAKLNIDNNLLTAAQNRIYYALFYSVLALGYSNGFVTGKHGQLLGWFNKVFIHEKKVFSSELFALYKEAFENRTKSDYQFTWKPKKDELLVDLEQASNFVQQIKDYIYAQS